jgi:hypothetical protein
MKPTIMDKYMGTSTLRVGSGARTNSGDIRIVAKSQLP